MYKMGEHKWSYLPHRTAKDETRTDTKGPIPGGNDSVILSVPFPA